MVTMGINCPEVLEELQAFDSDADLRAKVLFCCEAPGERTVTGLTEQLLMQI